MTDKNEPGWAVLTYKINLQNKNQFVYRFRNEDGLKLDCEKETPEEEWMKLGFHQCPNCTLDLKTVAQCPVSTNLHALLKDWDEVISYDTIELEVISPQRTIVVETTAQKALSSLLGLIMATSDCPHTRFFKVMAKFHLPMANNEETAFRVLSTFVMMKVFQSDNDAIVNFNFQDLNTIYENMHIINVHIKDRLQNAVKQDAALNAVVLLDMFAIGIPYFLDDELEKLRKMFSTVTETAAEIHFKE